MSLPRTVALLALCLACSADDPTERTEQSAETAPPSPQERGAGQVDGARIAAADQEPGSWLAYGRTYADQRYSALEQIDRESVAGLGLTWSFELGSTRGVEATPLVVDGVMYVSAPWSVVHALDAATGREIWRFDPQTSRDWARHACCDVVNRGVAVWKGAVFVGTIDGRLISIDAATGKPIWEAQTTPPDRAYTITGAPRVLKDLVIIGNGGAERGVRGYVTAYHAATGEQAWRFYTVPGDPSLPFEHPELEAAAATWTGEWWKVGGGGTAWDAMVFDPELDLLYVGTGNGSPWTRYRRSPGGGDNLFLASILALRPDTGELVWHYQTTPGDNWDYTATQPLMLAELEIEGRIRRVIMQAPKNGFFYVLDRETGELISAEAFVPVNWASHVDPATGRPVETGLGDYEKEARLVFPGPSGAHNWHPMAFHPGTGLVYIPAQELDFWYTDDPSFEYRFGHDALGLDFRALLERFEERPPEMKGKLLAWDPVAQKQVWHIDHAGYWNGGLLATAGGLLFQGTGDGAFRAYDVATGEALWEVQSQTGIMAAPISYEIDGVQYVAVAAGYGGGALPNGYNPDAIINNHLNEGRVLAFAPGGSAPMPVSPLRDATLRPPPAQTASVETIASGQDLFHRYCSQCHGPLALGSWVVPDLRYSSHEMLDNLEAIVLGGALRDKGMPDFAEFLDPAGVALIRSYVIDRASRAYEESRQDTL